MILPSRLFSLLCISILLSSCEFSCKLDQNKEIKAGKPKVQDGAILYNNIQLTPHIIKVNKAYLVFANGERVPEDNFVDFTNPVKLVLLVDKGWNSNEGRVKLGGSEKVMIEGGRTILDEKDLFESYKDGVSEEDAKIISLTVELSIKPGSPPATFIVSFRVWDKSGEGFVEGSYKLFSK